MRYILSWGGGVNSTAILAMMRLGMLPELTPENTTIVFADTGAEMPYTYEHTTTCRFMDRHKWKWVLLHPQDERYLDLYSVRVRGITLPQYCMQKPWLPSSLQRFCTNEYKTIPITNYRRRISSTPKMWKEETCVLLGIATDEIHRAREQGKTYVRYPLIEQGLNRQGCLDLCVKAGLPTPQKSGCWICPFQRKAQWLDLYHKFPEYFKQVEDIENNKNLGENKFYLLDMPIREKIKKWLKKEKSKCDQPDMFELDRHCLCEL